MNDIVFIIAGKYDEYLHYLRNKYRIGDNINRYRYVGDSTVLRGHVNISGFYIGTYYTRHDLNDLKQLIAMSKRK